MSGLLDMAYAPGDKDPKATRWWHGLVPLFEGHVHLSRLCFHVHQEKGKQNKVLKKCPSKWGGGGVHL